MIDADEVIQATSDYLDGLIDWVMAYRVWILYAPSTRSVNTREWSSACTRYDQDGSGVIERAEVIRAIRDYFDDEVDLSRDELLEVLNCFYGASHNIAISGLASPVESGESDEFTVTVSGLLDSDTYQYTIKVTTSNSNIGFDDDCSVDETEATFTGSSGVTSQSRTFTLYACSAPSGIVEASLHLNSGSDEIGNIVSDSQHVTVRAAPPPANRPPVFADGVSTTRSVPENTPPGRNIGNAVVATDPDRDTLTYNLGGTDAASFDFDESTGQLETKAALDYETKTSYTLTVSVSDDEGGTDSITVTVTVTNVNEPGAVALSPSSRPAVGMTITASLSDPDGNIRNERWQWRTTDGDINGARSSSYTPRVTDVGRTLNATVTYDDGHGTGKRASSPETSAVIGKPGPVRNLTAAPGDESLTVSWDSPSDNGGADISRYDVQHVESSLEWIDPSRRETFVTHPTTEADIPTLTNGVEYKVRVRACNSSGCGDWSPGTGEPDVTGTPRAKLAAPTDLDITPMSMRRAKLSWTGDPYAANDSNFADDYTVQVRRPGGEWQEPNLREQSGIGAVILLDVIWEEYSNDTPPVLLESGGLANLTDNVDFEYRVKALYDTDVVDTADPYVDSDWSKSVRLMDTPITSINGISTGTDGQALVKWSRVPGAVKYKLRWRRIPAATASTEVWETVGVGRPPRFRQPDDEWCSTYTDCESEWSNFIPVASGKLQHELTGLNIADVYAVQLVYERHDGSEGFSGRESYVWPWPSTKKFPNDGAKVATYPFFGHWASKEYQYSICSDTFSGDWDSLIEDAFNQWDTATGLVRTTRVTLDCGVDDAVPFTLFTGFTNDINEVYRVNTLDDHNRVATLRQYASNMTSPDMTTFGTVYFCIFFAPSCTISPADNDWPRYYGSLSPTPSYARHELPGGHPEDAGSVDILVNQERDNTWVGIPMAVRFNTCIGPERADYTNYELMVHEAGHALGIMRRVPWTTDWERYARDHSTIPDSVMNYDEEIQDNRLPDGTIRQEKDCAPHPFDIMAIYALYQGLD